MSRECNFHYARSRAGQYISHNDSKSVPRYDHIESCVAVHCESAWIALLIHGFSAVNARLLITCDIAFYAIILF